MLPAIKVRHLGSDMPVAPHGSGTCRFFWQQRSLSKKFNPMVNCRRKPLAKWLWVADRVQLQVPVPIGNAHATEIDWQQTDESACSKTTSFWCSQAKHVPHNCLKACTPPQKPWIKSEASGVIASTLPIILSIINVISNDQTQSPCSWCLGPKNWFSVAEPPKWSKTIILSVFSSLQNRAMLKQHPTAASTQATGATFLQCRWLLHWGGPHWIAEWQSWGAQSLARHVQWYQILQNGIKMVHVVNYIIIWIWRDMICCPMCLLLSVVICIMTDDSGIIPHAMNFLAPFTLHISTTASFPGDAPSHNSIAQNLQGLHSRSKERMGKDRNCTLDKHADHQ